MNYYLCRVYHESQSAMKLKFKTFIFIRAIDVSAFALCDNVYLEFEKPFEEKDIEMQKTLTYAKYLKRYKDKDFLT